MGLSPHTLANEGGLCLDEDCGGRDLCDTLEVEGVESSDCGSEGKSSTLFMLCK